MVGWYETDREKGSVNARNDRNNDLLISVERNNEEPDSEGAGAFLDWGLAGEDIMIPLGELPKLVGKLREILADYANISEAKAEVNLSRIRDLPSYTLFTARFNSDLHAKYFKISAGGYVNAHTGYIITEWESFFADAVSITIDNIVENGDSE